jgi:ATP-dependent RNA helicase DeaD
LRRLRASHRPHGRLSGEAGFTFTFVCPDEGEQLTNIEMRINKMLPQYQFKDFESSAARPQAGVVAAPPPVEKPTVEEEEAEFATSPSAWRKTRP